MTQAVEFIIDRLWTLQVTWCTGTISRYPASNAQEAATLQRILEVHPMVIDVQRHAFEQVDLLPTV